MYKKMSENLKERETTRNT